MSGGSMKPGMSAVLKNCPSDTTRVTLTITPTITNNTLSDNGEAFCGGGNPANIDGATPGGGDGDFSDDYQWQHNSATLGGWTDIGGATSEDYNPPAITETTSYRRVINSGTCSSISNEIEVIVYPLATVTAQPGDVDICGDDYSTNGEASFTVGVGGALSDIQWQRWDGSSWDDIIAADNPNDNCVYGGYTGTELTISSADFPMDGYEYRARLTTTAGGCVTTSAPATLTVYPAPEITTQPAEEDICESESGSFTVAAGIADGTIDDYEWRYNGNVIGAATHSNIYTGYDAATLSIDTPPLSLDGTNYSVVITSDQGCDVLSNDPQLNIYELATITTPPAAEEICDGENATFTITASGPGDLLPMAGG